MSHWVYNIRWLECSTRGAGSRNNLAFIDSAWSLQSIPIATLDIGDTSKNCTQLCVILEENMHNNPVVGSESIRVHTVTSDNDAATSLETDFLQTMLVQCAASCIH